LLNVNEINFRLDLVQALVEDTEIRQGLRQHLKRIADIERLTRVLQKKTSSLIPVVKLYQVSSLTIEKSCLLNWYSIIDLTTSTYKLTSIW
jgi:DNA mismatch repair ATPase MutS